MPISVVVDMVEGVEGVEGMGVKLDTNFQSPSSNSETSIGAPFQI